MGLPVVDPRTGFPGAGVFVFLAKKVPRPTCATKKVALYFRDATELVAQNEESENDDIPPDRSSRSTL